MSGRVFKGFTHAQAEKNLTGTPKHCGFPMDKLTAEQIWECHCGAHVIGGVEPEDAKRYVR